MMRKGLCIVIGLLPLMVFTQNLVPNPSLEVIENNCPWSYGVLDILIPWINPTGGSPDALNSCATMPDMSTPHNFMGYTLPKTGNGYAGFFTFYVHPNYPEAREYIQAPLDSPLIAGESYTISFYVSLGSKSKYASNHLGAYLSVNKISQPNVEYFTCCTPQIDYPMVITDTTNWTLVSGVFTAIGGEQYITIGNFYNNSNSIIIYNNPGGVYPSSYYFIDDVSVVKGNTIGTTEFFSNNKISLFPNPADNVIVVEGIESEMEELQIYSAIGKDVSSMTVVNCKSKNSVTIDITELPPGFYYLKTKTRVGKVYKK